MNINAQSLEIVKLTVKRKHNQEPLGFLFETEDTPAGDTVITAVVDTVDKFSPASAGGLRESDHILAIGGMSIYTTTGLLSAAAAALYGCSCCCSLPTTAYPAVVAVLSPPSSPSPSPSAQQECRLT